MGSSASDGGHSSTVMARGDLKRTMGSFRASGPRRLGSFGASIPTRLGSFRTIESEAIGFVPRRGCCSVEEVIEPTLNRYHEVGFRSQLDFRVGLTKRLGSFRIWEKRVDPLRWVRSARRVLSQFTAQSLRPELFFGSVRSDLDRVAGSVRFDDNPEELPFGADGVGDLARFGVVEGVGGVVLVELISGLE